MITAVTIWQYSLPLEAPLYKVQGDQAIRHGLLIQWHRRNHIGNDCVWSEVCPLPGFSDESLEGATIQLMALFESGFLHSVNNADQGSHWNLISEACFPSVKFGLEMGLMKLFPRLNSDTCSTHAEQSTQRSHALPIAGLITDGKLDIQRYRPYPVVKVKVGKEPLAADIKQVNTILKAFNPAKIIRLDANQSWSLDEAEYFFSKIPLEQIAFIEEPLKTPFDYSNWHTKIPVPFAFDEQVQNPEFTLLPVTGLKALVLKPMLIGLRRTIDLITQAKKLRIETMISSAYESSLSLNFLYQLALRYTPELPPGLDTFRSYRYDLIEPLTLPVERQKVSLAPESSLNKVAHYEC